MAPAVSKDQLTDDVLAPARTDPAAPGLADLVEATVRRILAERDVAARRGAAQHERRRAWIRANRERLGAHAPAWIAVRDVEPMSLLFAEPDLEAFRERLESHAERSSIWSFHTSQFP